MIENDYLVLGTVFTKLVVVGREFKVSPHSEQSNKFQVNKNKVVRVTLQKIYKKLELIIYPREGGGLF